MERHALGSQAFVPLTGSRLLLVVSAPNVGSEPGDLAAFVSDGRQGVNYHRGTWHHPLVALDAGAEFLVIERTGPGVNLEEWLPPDPVIVELPT